MKPPFSTPLLAASILTLATAVGAQAPLAPSAPQIQPNRRELVGLVRDPAGAAIEGATIEIRGASAGTNAQGAFQIWTGDIDTLTISVRRLGFSAISAMLTARNGQWDTVVVEMERASQRLSAVTVTGSSARRALGLRDFEERRAVGNGVFVTRDEIAARNTMRTSDVVRGKRGINLVRLKTGFGVRFSAYRRSWQTCAPDVWLDGVLARDVEIDDLTANDIEAMELYESFATVPSQFTPRGSGRVLPCGTIVIWTRVPGR